MNGHEIIERALKKALKADYGDAPMWLSFNEAKIWHQAQAAAYQHALEMIPKIEKNK